MMMIAKCSLLNQGMAGEPPKNLALQCGHMFWWPCRALFSMCSLQHWNKAENLTIKIYLFGPKRIFIAACQFIGVTDMWCHRMYPLYDKQNLKPILKFLTPLFPAIWGVSTMTCINQPRSPLHSINLLNVLLPSKFLILTEHFSHSSVKFTG